MITYRFYEDPNYNNLQGEFSAPYEQLRDFIRGDVQFSDMAQDWINSLTPVIEGKLPHLSANGNSWWVEAGPERTRMGDMFVKPDFELEVPTRWLVEMLSAFRDAQRARARADRLAREAKEK